MTGLRILWLAAALVAVAPPVHAEDDETRRRIEALEQRIEELEAESRERAEEPPAPEPAPEPEETEETYDERDDTRWLSEWTRRVKLGGSADVGYFWGGNDSVFDGVDFAVWDARFFLDVELGDDVRVADTQLIRNAGFSFEWNLVRLGQLTNDVGDLYVELQGLLGSEWANLQVGRFQIPVGEAYLLYGKGYGERTFVTNPVGGPWFWDEGIKLYGSGLGGRLGYVASVSDGDTSFNLDSTSDKQLTLKLFADPLPWLHVSLSGLRSGRLGNSTTPASGALWLGESWARAFGSGSPQPNFVGGVVVPDGPNVLSDTYLVGGDVVLSRPHWGSLWLAYGAYWIESAGDAGLYDTTLQYWIAELTLEGALAADVLEPFYLGLRANGLGTYDSRIGYLLDVRYSGSLGYNMKAMNAYTAVLGWRLTRWLWLRAEYSYVDIDLVRGAPAQLRAASNDASGAAVELGLHF